MTTHPLRAARRARHWSQRDLARRSGICVRTIVHIENGQKGTRHDTKRALLRALGMGWSDRDAVFPERA